MSKVIKLNKGLDIKLNGEAEKTVKTGNITFFKDGKYKVRVTPEELKKFLHHDFSGFVVG